MNKINSLKKKITPAKEKIINNTAGELAGGSTNIELTTTKKNFIFFQKIITPRLVTQI